MNANKSLNTFEMMSHNDSISVITRRMHDLNGVRVS